MQRFTSPLTAFIYTHILKPIFFRFDPETLHHAMVETGVRLGKSGFAKTVTAGLWAYSNKKLLKRIDGITFPNPVGLSAGFDYQADLVGILPAVGFGFHTIGTITYEPYEGNPLPRLGRFPRSKALLVNKGLKNLGAKATIAKLARQKMLIPTGISIASTNKSYADEEAQIKDILKCFVLFEQSKLKHAYYELNISCPNTFGGEPFTTPAKLKRLVKKMDTLKLSRPLYVKMPIDQSLEDTRALLKVLAVHNVQGVIFGNLTKDKSNPAVDPKDAATWQTVRGNLSGKPTWQRSNEKIQLTKAAFGSRFTIIGTGGIFSGQDAKEKMKLGADLVQLITGMVYQGPQLIGQINRHLLSTS